MSPEARTTKSTGRRALDSTLTDVVAKLDAVCDILREQNQVMQAQGLEIQDLKSAVVAVKEVAEAYKSVKLWGEFMKWVASVGAAALFLYALWVNKDK